MEFLAWEAQQKEQRQHEFLTWFKFNVDMSDYNIKFNFRNQLCVQNVIKDPKKLTFLTEAAADQITSEIGSPINSFDVIVGVEQSGNIDGANIGQLLAKYFNIGYVPMRSDDSLPGLTMWQRFDTMYGPSTL